MLLRPADALEISKLPFGLKPRGVFHLHVVTFPFRVQVKLGLSTGATGVTGAGATIGAGRPIRAAAGGAGSNLTHQCSDRYAKQQPCNKTVFLSLVCIQNTPRKIRCCTGKPASETGKTVNSQRSILYAQR